MSAGAPSASNWASLVAAGGMVPPQGMAPRDDGGHATISSQQVIVVRSTSSEEEQVPFVIVQRKVTVLLSGSPLTVVAGSVGELMVTPKEVTSVHIPEPVVGVLAAIVATSLLQIIV